METFIRIFDNPLTNAVWNEMMAFTLIGNMFWMGVAIIVAGIAIAIYERKTYRLPTIN